MKAITSLIIATLLMVLAGCASQKSTVPKYVDGEPVNVGYGEVARGDITYSVGHVKNKPTEVYNSIYDYFQAKVPGVRVEKNGNRGASIFVRGINSINSSTEPLFIVDGVAVDDISNINPYEVKSVDVLKDGSAAIYGVRGANGVIIITLKRE